MFRCFSWHGLHLYSLLFQFLHIYYKYVWIVGFGLTGLPPRIALFPNLVPFPFTAFALAFVAEQMLYAIIQLRKNV